jgi:arginyl-tRNA synthetase
MWIRSSYFSRAALVDSAARPPTDFDVLKQHLEELLLSAIAHGDDGSLTRAARAVPVLIERTRAAQHGDFATNVALRLAKTAGRKPRELAEQIAAALPPSGLVARTEVAGAGFINFFLSKQAYAEEIARIHREGERYGRGNLGRGERVLVEFVSANPTGPLHVGHGRQAAYGATLAALLDAAGFSVEREYYINDAGRQMDILAVSVWLRYLELASEDVPFPSNGYRGDYVYAIAQRLLVDEGERLARPGAAVMQDLPADAPAGDKEKHIDALIARARQLLGAEGFDDILKFSLAAMLRDIRADLAEFGVVFEHWTSERAFAQSGAIERALARLEREGQLYREEGAVWFRAERFGDEKNRVVVRENGQTTYFASDIAYHLQKRERGFQRLLDVLGADHHGYVARVRAGLAAMGEPPESLEATLVQFVNLYRGAEKIPMGKRAGQFVTLRELRAEVGNDACRLFFLMRSHDQPLDFDLELAKSKSNENPVYYIQYAHARIASVLAQLAARGLQFDRDAGLAQIALLALPPEELVLQQVTRFPEIIESCAASRAPHGLVHYLRELANALHSYYNAEQFIVEEASLRNARLALVVAVQQVLRNGLALLGVAAPTSM